MMITGIDVSHWNGAVNWQTAKSAGAAFMFAKATQGLTFKDDTFSVNYAGAKDAGLLRGAYHFYDYRQFGKPQAEYFWSVIKGDPGEIPPVLDLEYYWLPYPAGSKMLIAAKDFITALDDLSGRATILYTSPSMIRGFGSAPAWLLDHPLWIANYGVTNPAYSPWKRWTFWQTTGAGSGKTYGCASAGVDLNVYDGTLDELRAFCGAVPPVVPLTLEERVAKLETVAKAKGWNL